jgi:hypothetical protein
VPAILAGYRRPCSRSESLLPFLVATGTWGRRSCARTVAVLSHTHLRIETPRFVFVKIRTWYF